MRSAPPGTSTRPGRRAAAVVALLVLTSMAATACRRDGDVAAPVSREYFEAKLVDREKLTPDQARCVSTRVFEDYDTASVRKIADGGILALPNSVWTDYAYTIFECALGDELTTAILPARTSGSAPGTTAPAVPSALPPAGASQGRR